LKARRLNDEHRSTDLEYLLLAIDFGLQKLTYRLEWELRLLMAEDLLVDNLPEIDPGLSSGYIPLWLLLDHSEDLAIRYSIQEVRVKLYHRTSEYAQKEEMGASD
jgi:hypothetical protein